MRNFVIICMAIFTLNVNSQIKVNLPDSTTVFDEKSGIHLDLQLNSYLLEANISYINCDALNFDVMECDEKFTKVFLYEVIQHVNYRDMGALFAKLKEITSNNATIFIGGILDEEKKWAFFNTTERRCMYFSGLLSENNPLGIWFHKDFFKYLARKHNLHVECIPQENKLYTSHYRFDCLLRKK